MTKTLSNKDGKLLVLLVILFSLYAAVFIYKTSFVIEGERYFCLFDDAMVSMRYARNLVEGHGLLMNPGERIEGITNPLWTVYMAAFHLLPLPQPKISLLIQISATLFLAANLVFVQKIARLVSENSPAVSIAAMFLTAFYLPLINWSLQGMEVCILTLIMSIAVWRTIISLRNKTISPVIFLLLGISTLIRIDMAVPFIGILLFLVIVQPELRTKNLLWGVTTLVFFLGLQTAFRAVYYGELLPNTYYLKMTGYPILFRISRGFIVWWKFIWNMNLLLFIVPVFTLVFAYNHSHGLLAVVVVFQMIYSIYVGGDAWDDWGGSNRYIAIAMPQFFILFSYGLFRIRDIWAGISIKKNTFQTKAFSFIRNHYFTAIILLFFIQLNSNSGTLTLRGLAFIDLPPHVENNRAMVERANLIKHITTPDASIAVTWAGIIPYFSERYTVDILGKTDKTVARLKMRTASENDNPYTHFLPGHLKYDYGHSIGKLKPDAVLQYWGDLREADRYIVGNYFKVATEKYWVYLLNGSKNVRWDLFVTESQKSK